MTSENKKEEFTVQGADPPVPVGDGGVGTGHPRPSSCDSPAPSVAHQAGVQKNATGRRGESDSGRNGKSLFRELKERMEGARSTPVSPNVSSVDYAWDELSGRSIKRRRQGSGYWDAEITDGWGPGTDGNNRVTIKKLLNIMDKEIRQLAKLVQENSNTKREIKDVSSSLRSLSSRLMTDAMQQALTDGPSDWCADSKESGTQTEVDISSRDIGTQTADEDYALAEISRGVRECGCDEDFLQLIQKPWPEELYQCTTVGSEDPVDGVTDLALYAPGGNMCGETMTKAAARFPELVGMGRGSQRDHIGSLLCTTCTRDGDAVSKKERLIYKMTPATRAGRGPVEEFLQMARSLGRHMRRDGKERVSLQRPPDISLEETRKTLEYIFQGTDTRVLLYEPGPGRDSPDRPAAEENATVIVKPGEKSFVEALKDVKGGLRDSAEVRLKAVRKTQRGDILLVVKGGAEGAKALEMKIRSKTGMVAHAQDAHRKTLLIQGLDGVTTKEEVTAAVQNHLGGDAQQGFSVASLRPTRRDNQTATLFASREVADRLLEDGRIYIGWLECRIKERIDLPKCFKCLEYGHTRADCKGPSREDTCFKCGEKGHQAKGCTGSTDFCHACQREGHRSSSTNCPIFRKMVAEARDRARQGRGNRSGRVSNK